MSGTEIGKTNCLSCGSSDARSMYSDGASHCHSCGDHTHGGKKVVTEFKGNVPDVVSTKVAPLDIGNLRSVSIRERKITKEVTEFFGVKMRFNSEGAVDGHFYPYGESYKLRVLPKTFTWIGHNGNKLFGQDKFNSDGKRVIITEGEIDAMSVAQAALEQYGKIYPVVSIASASGTKALLENREWLRSFKEIVLCFDGDDAGREATEKAIKILGADKVRLVKLPFKDANQTLVEKDGRELMSCIFGASKYVPSGIMRRDELWQAMIEYNSVPVVPYPPCLEALNTKLKGMREHTITLFTSGTGSGKSTITREIALHLVSTQDTMVGIVALEEPPAETARKLAGMAISRDPSNEELSAEDLKCGFDSVFGDDRIMVLDHQGSMDDTSLMDKLEYMCLSGCKYIILDHITILVSEGVDGLQGNEAIDRTMNDLLRLVSKHPVWLCLVSHLRKTQTGKRSFEEGQLPSLDDIKGSGSIKQVSMEIVAFSRDMTNDDELIKNHINMRVLKSRFTGLTGNIPGVDYIPSTGRLRASTDDFITI
jgi:twinkle protein